jgi:hypothetical protein
MHLTLQCVFQAPSLSAWTQLISTTDQSKPHFFSPRAIARRVCFLLRSRSNRRSVAFASESATPAAFYGKQVQTAKIILGNLTRLLDCAKSGRATACLQSSAALGGGDKLRPVVDGQRRALRGADAGCEGGGEGGAVAENGARACERRWIEVGGGEGRGEAPCAGYVQSRSRGRVAPGRARLT